MSLCRAVLSGGRWLQGEQVESFETRLARMAGRRHAVAVGSCTDALYFALKAAGIGAGDEVLVPAVSFVASASAVVRAGARPVFVDVDAEGLLDFTAARRVIGSRTKAMIFVHLYGLMGDPRTIENFARRAGLEIIEDAAQALGARRTGRAAGSLGLASCLSFDPTKPIGAPGSGGAVLTDDAGVAESVRRQRYHGRGKSGNFEELGYNSQMPTLTAGLLELKLGREAAWRRARIVVARRYARGLAGVSGLILPRISSRNEHIYHKFVIRHRRRDDIRRALTDAGIETMIHYARPLPRQPLFARLPGTRRPFPMAEKLCEQALSLPMHPFLTEREIARVVSVVRRASGA